MAVTTAESRLFDFMAERIPDKIVYRNSVTYSVPLAGGILGYTEYVIPHGLPFVPLILGAYSFDDFATSYDFGTGPFEYLTTYAYYGYSILAHAWADSTNITIRVISHNTARTVTFHMLGLTKGFSSGSIEVFIPTPPVQDKLLFNSDLNTLKHHILVDKPMSTNGLGTYVTHSYPVNTDLPFTSLCFIEEDGKRSFMNTMNTITNSGVTFSTVSAPTYFKIGVASTSIKTVNIIVKAYVDA